MKPSPPRWGGGLYPRRLTVSQLIRRFGTLDYKSVDILRLFVAAAAGDQAAADRLSTIDVPFAASPDWSEMVLVQLKSSTIDEAGRVRVLNMPPTGNGRPQQVLDIYTRNANGTGDALASLPSSFLCKHSHTETAHSSLRLPMADP